MSVRSEEIKMEALNLPRDEREDVARALLESLDEDLGLDPETYAEILRRVEEIRSGRAEMIDGEEFIAELEEFLGEKGPAPSKSAS